MGIFGNRKRKSRLGKSDRLPPNRRRKGSSKRGAGGKPVRSRESRLRARRIALALVKLVVAGVVTGLCLWGGLLAYEHATTAEYFAVDAIDVEGADRLGIDQVRQIARVKLGMNVFAVDVDEAAARLRADPWIAEAEASRRLPRSVRLEIVERKAEAMVLFDVPYLVDDSGEVFKRWAIGDPRPVPILTGFTREQFAVDGDEVLTGIHDAISLTRRYRAAGLERVAPLAEIHREVDASFSLTIGEDPFYVKFGKGPYRKKLKRLVALLRQIKRDGERPAMVFFDNEVRPDRVTVKLKPRGQDGRARIVQISTVEAEKNPPKI
jgi:cell division protein FtsQ